MRWYLVRLHETGRDAQPGRQKVRRDVVARLRAHLPGASIETRPGRVVLGCDGDAAPVLRELHGVLSYSPARRCAPADAAEVAAAMARDALAETGARRFRVRARVRHNGAIGQRATEIEAGRHVCTAIPGARVDLVDPEVRIGIEIDARDAFVFRDVVPGLDRVGVPLPAPREPRFLVDHMLGAVVGWLRLLGYDTAFAGGEADSALVRRARAEHRVLLTRDRELARTRAARVFFVEPDDPEAQLGAIAAAFGLSLDDDRAFTRCCACNAPVQPAPDAVVARHLRADIAARYARKTWCSVCDKVYWEGPQYHRIVEQLQRALTAG